MRILLTTHGAYGHFHPIAPLALAAQEAGHDVLVATGPDLLAWVCSCGLRAEPVGLASADYPALLAALPEAYQPRAMFHRFSTIAVPPMLEDLRRLTRDWQPDVVIHEEGEYAAPLLAAILQVPCVTHSWAAPARPLEERELYRELLAPIWAANGLAGGSRTSGATYLDACPPPYQSDAITSIEGVVATQPGLFDGPPTAVPDWLADLPRPAAYVTFGTVAHFSRPEVLRHAVEAVAPLVASVVVTTGPNPAGTVGITAPHVRVVDYLQQSQLLPHVDLVVSHGGAGTTVGALTRGVPHLVMPGVAPSQQRNALRTQEIGLGRVVQLDADVEEVRSVAQELLANPSYGAACIEARAELEKLPSVEETLRLVEALAVRSRGTR